MSLLTSAEAADYLRMKERKLYELVAERAVPCTKITGRWLFPKADLDRWLRAGLAQPGGMAVAEPMPIVGGSHDPLLEWALRESGCGLAILSEGSEAGLARFAAGELMAAAIHLHTLEPAEADANVAAAGAISGLGDGVLIGFVRREQGLVVAPGNPLALATLKEAVARGARFAQRQRGAGAQLLLVKLLREAGLSADALPKGPVCTTGNEVAHAVLTGRADCGVASRSAATMAGLGFVPLLWERFDLLMRQRDYFRPPLQKLFAFMRSDAFVKRAAEMTGYDTADAGAVRYVA